MIERSVREVVDKEISPQLVSIQEMLDRIEEKVDILYDDVATLE